MRIFCPAIASLRPSLSSTSVSLRPPRSGVSRARNARDSPLRRPGVVIGARSRTEPRHGLRSGAPARRTVWGAPRRPRLSNLNIVPEIGAETPIGGFAPRFHPTDAWNRVQSRGPRGLRARALADLVRSLDDLGDPAGADGAATFTD